jgi:uncharacterized protein
VHASLIAFGNFFVHAQFDAPAIGRYAGLVARVSKAKPTTKSGSDRDASNAPPRENVEASGREGPAVTQTPNGVRLKIWAKPRASRSQVLGEKDGAIVVALAAPPVDGAANAELLDTLVRALRVPRQAVTLVGGATGRHKRVEVAGLTVEGVAALLNRS